MAQTIEQQIRVIIQGEVKGMPQVQAFSDALKNMRPKGKDAASGIAAFTNALREIPVVGGLAFGVLQKLKSGIEFFLASLASLAASSPFIGLGYLVKEGIAFNAELEKSKLGIAALIASSSTIKDAGGKKLEGNAAFDAAYSQAERLVSLFRVAAIPLEATSQQLTNTFKQVVASGAAAGLTLDQLYRLTVTLTGAANALEIPTERLGTEIRLLFAGTVRETSRLGTALFGSAAAARDFVKEHKKIGDLADALTQKLGQFNILIERNSETLGARATAIKDAFQVLASEATASFYDHLKEGLGNIADHLIDPEKAKKIVEGILPLDQAADIINEKLQPIIALIDQILGLVGEVGERVISKIIGYVEYFSDLIKKNPQEVDKVINGFIYIGIQIYRIIKSFGQLLGEVFKLIGSLLTITGEMSTVNDETKQAGLSTNKWVREVQTVAINIAQLRDSLDIVVGILQTGVAGALIVIVGLVGIILLGFTAIFDSVKNVAHVANDLLHGRIPDFSKEFTVDTSAKFFDAFLKIEGALKEFATSGAERFARGFAGTAEKSVREAIANNSGFHFDPNFKGGGFRIPNFGGTFTPNKAPEETDDKAEKERQQAYKENLKAYADYIRSRLAEEKALAEQERQDQKDAADLELAEEKNKFDEHLIGIAEYFNKRRAIYEAEKGHVKDFYNLVRGLLDAEYHGVIDPKTGERSGGLIAEKNLEFDEKEKEVEDAEAKKTIQATRRLEIQKLENEFKQKDTDLVRKQNTELEKLNKNTEQSYKEQTKASEELSKYVNDILAAAAEGRGRFKEAFDLRQQVQQAEVLKRLTAERNAARTKQEREGVERAIKAAQDNAELERYRAEFRELQEKLNQEREALKNEEERLRYNGEQAGLSSYQIEKAVLELEQKRKPVLEDLARQLNDIANKSGDKNLVNQAQAINLELVKLGQNFDSLAKSINDIGRTTIQDFFKTLIEGTDSFGDAMKRLFSGFFAQIAEAIFQALVLQNILKFLKLDGSDNDSGGFGGGLVSLIGKLNSFFSGLFGFAEGGFVTGSGTSVSDSIPAMLSHGEAVIPADSVARYGREMISAIINGTFLPRVRLASGGIIGSTSGTGQASGGRGISIFNILDPSLVRDYLASKAGHEAILNVISQNPGAIRELMVK